MGILFGFLMVSLGLGGIIGSISTRVIPIIIIISVILIIGGIVIIYYSYRKGQRKKLSQLNMRIKKQCPGCYINVTDDCPQCPRCGMKL